MYKKMKKLAINETYPTDYTGRNIIWAKMSNHYRRIYSAKPRVDTNIRKSPKTPRKMSPDVCKAVDRNYNCSMNSVKNKRCLKYQNGELIFKPVIHSTNAESKLKSLEVYHPPTFRPVKKGRSLSQTPEEEIIVEEDPEESVYPEGKEPEPNVEDEKTKLEEPKKETVNRYVQTQRSHRPLEKKSIKFLKDITDEALRKGAFTDRALQRIFKKHEQYNKYNLDEDLMEQELTRLAHELGMGLKRYSTSDYRENSYTDLGRVPSDAEALEALDSLLLSPEIRHDVIQTLGLSTSDSPNNEKGSVKEENVIQCYSVLSKQPQLDWQQVREESKKFKDWKFLTKTMPEIFYYNGDENKDDGLLKDIDTTSEVSEIEDLEIGSDSSNNDSSSSKKGKKLGSEQNRQAELEEEAKEGKFEVKDTGERDSTKSINGNENVLEDSVVGIPNAKSSSFGEAIEKETDGESTSAIEAKTEFEIYDKAKLSGSQFRSEATDQSGATSKQSHSESMGGVKAQPQEDDDIIKSEADSKESSPTVSSVAEETDSKISRGDDGKAENDDTSNEMSSVHTETK